MSGKAFIDTNVFVYTQSKGEVTKRNIALGVFEKYECYTSTQVFNEVSNIMLKKLKMPVTEVKQVITAIDNHCEVSVINYETVQKALDLKEVYGYSYYDSLILATAILSNCDYILSEDLHDGQLIDSQTEIINIFRRSI
jgi:predicted nucleic acid-binding protein